MDAPTEIPTDVSDAAPEDSDNSLWKIAILFLGSIILILVCGLALGWIYEVPKWIAAYHYERAINYYSNSALTLNSQNHANNYCSALSEAKEAVNWFGLVVVHINSDKHPEYPSFVLLLLAVNWHEFPNAVCNAMGPIEFKRDFQHFYKTADEWAGSDSVTKILCELPRHPIKNDAHQQYLKEKLREAVEVDYLPETCSIVVNPPPYSTEVIPNSSTSATPTQTLILAPTGTLTTSSSAPEQVADVPTSTRQPTAEPLTATPQITVVTATSTNTTEPSTALLQAPTITIERGQIAYDKCRKTEFSWAWIRPLAGNERFLLRVLREHPTPQFETRAGGYYMEPPTDEPRVFRITDDEIEGVFWLFGYITLEGKQISHESNREKIVCGDGVQNFSRAQE